MGKITYMFTLKNSSKWISISMSHWSTIWIGKNRMNIRVMKKMIYNIPEAIGITIILRKCFRWTVLYQINPQTLKWAQLYKNVCAKWKLFLEMRVFVCLFKIRIENCTYILVLDGFNHCNWKTIGVKIWRVYLKSKFWKCARLSLSKHFNCPGNIWALHPCIYGYSDKYW